LNYRNKPIPEKEPVMTEEIAKLEEGKTYDVRYDAGYGDDVRAQVVSITAESVTLDLEYPNGAYASEKIVNENAEIERVLSVEFI
jgi:hypothetical protein